MARRHRNRILPSVIAALVVAASLPAQAADTPDCHAAAVEFAASVWHASPRLKIPVWTAIGVLIGRPGWMAVLAANAESPRERRMIADYELWCRGGFVGESPRIGPAILELF